MKWSASGDFLLSSMALEIKSNYDKYWGNVEKYNTLFYIANILDPKYKMTYLKWSFDDIYDPLIASNLLLKVRANLYKLYGYYELYRPKKASSGVGQPSKVLDNGPQEGKQAYKARNASFKSHLKEKGSIEAKNEVVKYLVEPYIDVNDDFSVLGW